MQLSKSERIRDCRKVLTSPASATRAAPTTYAPVAQDPRGISSASTMIRELIRITIPLAGVATLAASPGEGTGTALSILVRLGSVILIGTDLRTYHRVAQVGVGNYMGVKFRNWMGLRWRRWMVTGM